ncbi:sensor histidine kinase [Notoacmeibacter sp. MSK16QG-6]|uniref:sensor histidine kinase n=1 Tax=Notoacmeibacter sp. MSK16QG-6 TaxID=2957982 RepID=UPI0020A1E475|nr:sensor histidine kinase [Notoacmeibacter sp. MSK16QG-6]MCP1199116.1 sensor histidine kinase [Notoacmeibacter sp. MSK16QG-6]
MGSIFRLPQNLSLKSRVALAMATVLIVGGVVVLVAALAYGRQAAREAYDRLLVGAASDIAESITIRNGAALVDMPVSAFELLALAPDDRIVYRVLDDDGRTLTGYENTPLPRKSGETTFYDSEFGGEAARYVSLTRRFAERSFSGSVQVIVGQTLRARQQLARDIAQNALLVLGAAGAAMALFAWLVMQSALRPLPRIGEALRKRDPTDLTPIDLAAPSEIGSLIASLNGFMARLDRQMQSNRHLIGDAAHQLRTPVAAIRAHAQLALEEPDTERRSRMVKRIHDRAVGLSHLLDQMLNHAMIIHRADTAPRDLVDLRNVAVEAFEANEPAILAPSNVVALDLPDDPVTVRGDSLSLAEAAKNLLGNALSHGQPPVRIGVRDGVQAELWVRDAGEGPPETIRTDPATRFAGDRTNGGSGLGLAIAQAVATVHDGSIRMSADDDGFEAAMVLPKECS